MIPVFKATKKEKLVWDIFKALQILLFIFCIPVQLAFNIQIQNLLTNPVTIIFILCHLFDIFINMNSSYFSKGKVVLDKKRIFRHYCREHLLKDLLGTLPFCIFILNFTIMGRNLDKNSVYLYQIDGIILLAYFVNI